MDKKTVGWLYRELPMLVAKGVLAPEAAIKLRQHYGKVKDVNKKWSMIITCGIAGAFLIGLGIISLFAHNWEELSRGLRAVISFIPLIAGQGLLAWVLWKRPESDALKESTATFVSLMVGASIALIGQTYNIPGTASVFTLTWMLLILPLVYLARASLPAIMYLIGITAWAGFFWNNPSKAILFWPLAALIVPHFIWASGRETHRARTNLFTLAIIICVLIAAGFSLGKVRPGSWTVIYASIYAIFYFIGTGGFSRQLKIWQRPFEAIGLLGIIVLSFMFTYQDFWKIIGDSIGYSFFNKPHGLASLPDFLIIYALAGAAIFFFASYLREKDNLKILLGAMPIVTIFSYLVYKETTLLPFLFFNLYLVTIGVSHILIGIRKSDLGVMNIGVLVLAGLIVIRFFDSDINFVIKGLVFIFAGCGFLATNLIFLRRRGGVK